MGAKGELRIEGGVLRRASGERAGFTLIEVMISAVVLAFLLMASSSAFIGNLRGVSESRRLAQAAVFLETSSENLGAQPYANLLALDGTQLFDGPSPERSNFTLDVSAFQSQVDLIQMTAIVSDRRTGHELSRSVILRSNR